MSNAAAIDLNEYRSKKEEEIKLTPEETEALKAMAEQPEEVLAAFIVWIDYDGNINAASDLSLAKINPSRPATAAEMYGGCANVMKDINLQQSANLTGQVAAQNVIAGMMQATQQMQSQIQNAGLLNKLKEDNNFRNR